MRPRFLMSRCSRPAERDVFVARIDRCWHRIADTVELQPAQNAADGGPTEARLLRDAIAGSDLMTKSFDALVLG